METIYLRVADGLKRSVEARAKEDGESVNEFLTHVIEAAVRDDLSNRDYLSAAATIEFLMEIARTNGVVTYTEVAARQGQPMVRSKIIPHMSEVWHECRRRGLPSLTSLVVRKDSKKPSNGFLRLERSAGADVPDAEAEAYVAAKQEDCRSWAKSLVSPSPHPWAHLRGTWKGPDVDNFQDYMRGPPDETAPTK